MVRRVHAQNEPALACRTRPPNSLVSPGPGVAEGGGVGEDGLAVGEPAEDEQPLMRSCDRLLDAPFAVGGIGIGDLPGFEQRH